MEFKDNIKNLIINNIKKKIIEYSKIEDGFFLFLEEDEKNISSSNFESIENDIKKNNNNLHFKIDSIAQEEYKKDNKIIKVQKMKVVAFEKEKELQEYLFLQEELKKYDHRILGKQMELFEILPISPGNIFWLKNGTILYNKLQEYIRKHGYDIFDEVKTPSVMSNELWKTSGHLSVFKKNMMFVKYGESEDSNCALKPMNCPGHVELFKKQLRSYKELPCRMGEFGSCSRYEPSGALFGLMRIRSFVIDDGHIFCTKEQIKNEVKNFVLNAIKIYKHFTFENIKIIISTKPENALGEKEDWEYAENALQESLKESGVQYSIAHGEGAFYGPKIEIHVQDTMKREWQLGTIQLDFVLPERFDISFINKNGEKERPCMLHRAILGSIERFIGVLLEHTKGKLPLFIHPMPIAICCINKEVVEYAKKIQSIFKENEIISIVDERNESLSYKIKEHRTSKTPIIIVIGEKEMKSETVTIEYNEKKIHYNIMELKEVKKMFNDR